MTWQEGGAWPGDAIRFEEPIWGRRSQRHQDEIVGKRLITAQVAVEDGEWITLDISEVEILEYRLPGRPKAVKKSERRKRRNIERGRPQRLAWSDEEARAMVARDRGRKG